MHRTIFDTPVVNTVLRTFSVAFLKLTGWKIVGELPADARKSVFIAAPHTSNWDLPYTLMVAFALRLNIYWMGKAQIFRWPFGPLMRWLGGVAVQREQANNLVAASVQALQTSDGPVQLVVPPEGTRSKVRYWKPVLLHRPGRAGAHRDVFHGLRQQSQRPGPGFCADGRYRGRHGRHQSFLRALQGQEPGPVLGPARCALNAPRCACCSIFCRCRQWPAR